MMDLLNKKELETLIKKPKGLCVSFYMPTFQKGRPVRQNSIRFDNLLSEAEEKLQAAGLPAQEIKKFLGPAQKLRKDTLFWSYQSKGLAVFISQKFFRTFRLPIKFEKIAVVADHFHLKPLLFLLGREDQFYLLALSRNKTKLFKGDRGGLEEIKSEDIPESLKQALWYKDYESFLQFHSRAPQRGRERAAMFHGQGVSIDDEKFKILRYSRHINKGLHKLLRGKRDPLVLAAVDYFHPIYKEANTYPYLMEKGISGNPENLSSRQLHQKAWSIADSYFKKDLKQAIVRYRELFPSRRTSNNIRKIIPAAEQGRIDSLFVAVGQQQWGTFNPQTGKISIHKEPGPGDEDLLDYVAVQTFLKRGKVYVVAPKKVPDKKLLAAIFRY